MGDRNIVKSIADENKPVIVGLCKGRHELPVEVYIFEREIDPLDFITMRRTVEKFILDHVGLTTETREALDQRYEDDVPCFTGEHKLIVYVTGLTAATAAVIQVCAMNGVQLTLMHFDRDTGEYVPQEIF